MDAVDVIKDTFDALKSRPITFVIPLIVYSIVLGLLVVAIILLPLASLFTSPSAGTLSNNPAGIMPILEASIPGIVVLFILILIITPIATGMYIDLASKWKQKSLSLSESFNVAMSRIVDMVLYSILSGIVYFVILGIALLPFIWTIIKVASSGGMYSAHALGLILIFVISLIFIIILWLIISTLLYTASPIIILEKKGPIAALKASIEIGRRDFFGILALIVLVAVITFVVEIALNAINIIPIIGPIVFVVGYAFMLAFSFMVPPMYYITIARAARKTLRHKRSGE